MDKLGYIGIKRPLNSVHDFNGYTEEEVWTIISQKINVLIEHFNYIDKKLEHEKEYNNNRFNYLVNEGLDKSVAKEITKKIDDGTLNEIINDDILKTINNNIRDINIKLNDIFNRIEALEINK